MASTRSYAGRAAADATDDAGTPNARVARHLKVMRQEAIFSDGVIPARIKALAAALWSVSARCEPCIEAYMRKAQEFGATPQETAEMLAIASAMGGCVGETWANKALRAVEDGPVGGCCES